MLLNILNYLVQNLSFFTGAYSNNVFPEQLPKELEDEYNGYLSKLVIGGVTVDLVKGKTEYTVYLDNINSYRVSAIVADPDNFKIEDELKHWFFNK